jgi:FAD:protein FMN transferase
MITRRNAVFGLVGFGALAATGQACAVTVSRSGTTFGTTVRLTVSAETARVANAALDAGYAELRAVHAAASLFDGQSEVSRFNNGAAVDAPSLVLLHLARLSDQLWKDTNGAFDVSVQPLWLIWQMALRQQRQPTQSEIETALMVVGWQGLDARGLPLRRNDQSAITFNGIAQGYAADLVMGAFKAHGVTSGYADTGELAIDSADGTSVTRLAIRDPRDVEKVRGYIEVSEGFVATSGDYATTFTSDFAHNHIFDPASGTSPADLAAVTVVAPTGALADGLATAFMVMGVQKSVDYIGRNAKLGAVLISKTGETRVAGNIHYHT